MKMFAVLLAVILTFTPTVFAHDVNLTWVASAPVTGVTVAGYNVYRGNFTGGPYVLVNHSLVAPGVMFDDTTVQGGTKYFYVVTAVSTAQVESGYSNEASATTPLNAPTGLGGKITVLIIPNGGQHEIHSGS